MNLSILTQSWKLWNDGGETSDFSRKPRASLLIEIESSMIQRILQMQRSEPCTRIGKGIPIEQFMEGYLQLNDIHLILIMIAVELYTCNLQSAILYYFIKNVPSTLQQLLLHHEYPSDIITIY
mmetsp:Transcript_16219/g.30671  ORF Transcript_16219/g.30671 Transcript_16219/m.30671 type:complete len:123 (-) Transcript_16219:1464-1832(-)